MKNLTELQKQVVKFTLIGAIAVLTDMACYYVLLNILPEKTFSFIGNEVLGKSISFICGACVTYNLNKLWTWRKNDSSKKRFAKFMLLYCISLAINVSVNSLLLYILHEHRNLVDVPHKYIIAFVGATVVSALMNFAGQKFWVFTSNGNETEKEPTDLVLQEPLR